MNWVGSIVPGFVELALLIAILIIVFGARRLPALGEAIGRGLDRLRSRRAEANDASPPKT